VAVFGVLGFQSTKQKFGCFLGFRFEDRTQMVFKVHKRICPLLENVT
jgi:hypothetical protein